VQYGRLSRRDLVGVEVLRALLASPQVMGIESLVDQAVLLTDLFLAKLDRSQLEEERGSFATEFDDVLKEPSQEFTDEVLGVSSVEIDGLG
jgi:hypothetical protein